MPNDCLRWEQRGETLEITLPETLDTECAAKAWTPLFREVEAAGAVHVDASATKSCDGAGLALLRELAVHHDAKISGTTASVQSRLEPFLAKSPSPKPPGGVPRSANPVAAQFYAVGKSAHEFFHDVADILQFLGELAVTFGACLRNPRLVRWQDLFVTAERAGVNALLIVGVISLLTGMILAFQALTALRQFGVEIFVVNLVSLAMLREMGVIMTAVVLAGRSGSAFAAEIGTMKINEEVDALLTMGLEPVRFLVVPKVLAGILIMPALTLFANAMGIVGGLLVMRLEGYPLAALLQQLSGAVGINDLMVGFIKSFFFGFLVAAIGCLRGLQTSSNASAVGLSTTRAVVSGIFLIVVADAIFSGIFYVLKI